MSRAKGNAAEDAACEYLTQKGFVIQERNFYSRFGEIDIIALKEGVLHFIEVKSGESYEAAIYNITPNKLSKIIKTSQIYMSKYSLQCDYQFDGLIIVDRTITLIDNITL
ncbi:MAG: YraN family protein [Epsilonproteobacteria bacterium]|nr:YraN family protein [Campylobacterota bacterium]